MADNSIRPKVTVALKAIFPGSDHEVSLDRNGTITLNFDGDASLTLEVPEFGNVFHIYTPVLHIPANGRLAALNRALSLNLFSIAVPGTWLALDPEDDRFLLCLTLTGDRAHGEALTELFEDMLEEARRLQMLLSPGRAADMTENVMAPQDPSMIHFRI